MAGFAEDLQAQHLKNSSLSFLEMDSSLEFINQYLELNGIVLDNTAMNVQSVIGCCNGNYLSEVPMQPEFSTSAGCPGDGFFTQNRAECPESSQMPSAIGDGNQEPNLGNTKRKLMAVSDSNSWSCSSPISEIGLGEDDKLTTKKIPGKGKRVKSGNSMVCKEKRIEKVNEVIHVRAKRGQATDSHSLAERVRREKINERMRYLQDLVPGCYKTMGMTVMLDEIINYVHLLQHQVEFLSMKLSVASSYYDFSLDLDAAEAQQQALFQQFHRV